jgi:hypothetical protein
MGGEGAKDKLKPSTMMRGHLGHHQPTLHLLWVVQVGKVDMTKFTKCRLRVLLIIIGNPRH